MNNRYPIRVAAWAGAFAASLFSTPESRANGAFAERVNVAGYELLGEVHIPSGAQFMGTTVGGLSGLTYDPLNQVYHVICDDRSQINAARFYTIAIDLADGRLSAGDVQFLNVVTLRDGAGNPFPTLSLDPEGIALTPGGTLLVSSEGDANLLINPFVNEFSLTGQQLSELPIPAHYLPTAGGTGIRNNLAFESLTLSPDGRFLFTAVENALKQDGSAATTEKETLVRILRYDLTTGAPVQEYVYVADTVAAEPVPAGQFATSGLVELLALDNNGSFLALERSFSVGVGNNVKLYEAKVQGALDTFAVDSLFNDAEGTEFEIDPPVQKRLLLDVQADLGIVPDNLEGIALGPILPDGRPSLIIVSDDNFSPTQVSQFIALALDVEFIPAARPAVETPLTLDHEDAVGVIRGDSDDPAIWVHPTDPSKSLVLVTLKDGGLAVLDLHGQQRQLVLPAPFGDIRYNNVDLIYGFRIDGRRVDLAVASDRANDTLAIFKIDPTPRMVSDLTSASMLESIFGVDDGEATAYGLTTYVSVETGKAYAFVTQASGNQIAQLELFDDGSGHVNASVVRLLELPVPTGDPEDSQSEGIVVDRELGIMYVATEGEGGIFKIGAEPNVGTALELIVPFDAPFLQPDIEGLTIYYGASGGGYLLVSSQGDSTFAVLERGGANEYLGSFIMPDHGSIDQVNESDGADVLNVPLWPLFPHGLLVVQDGANDPQLAVQDDEELENISTNFKYVPWENVADALGLGVDPVSYHPRGSAQEQVAALRTDVELLIADGSLNRGRGRALIATLETAERFIERDRTLLALGSLLSFKFHVADLVHHRKLPPGDGRLLIEHTIALAERVIMTADRR